MTFIPSVLSEVDNGNSYTSNLTSNTSFTGTSKQTTGYATIDLTITSDQGSAASGIQIQFSDNGSTFTTYNTDTYFSGTIYTQTFKILKKYYRIVYTNGSVETSNFNLISRLNVNNPSGNSETNNNNYGNTDTGYLDAFGKMRVTNPFTLLDLQFPGTTGVTGTYEINNNTLMMCTGTTGTYENIAVDGYITLTGTGAGYQINQSRKYCNYQPGKSLLFMASGVIYESGPTGVNDYTARIGYFDSKNGLFFQYSSSGSGTMSVNVRNQNVDTSITQANWNIDKMDGTGLSGIELDFTKAQILIIDFEWLGVGCVRVGFVVDGLIFYCHQFNHANVVSGVYMSTPNLPLRYQIENTGSGAASSIECICSAVISEGGKEEIATNLYLSTGTSPVSVAKDQLNALLGFRLKPSYKGCTIDILDTGIYVSSIDAYEWRLIFNPTVAGTFTYVDVNNEPLQKAIGDGTTNIASGGTIIAGGYGTAKQSADTNALKALLKLGCSINGTMDTIVLCVYPLGNNALAAYGSVNYRAFL